MQNILQVQLFETNKLQYAYGIETRSHNHNRDENFPQSACSQTADTFRQIWSDNHDNDKWNFYYSACNLAQSTGRQIPESDNHSKDDEYFSTNLQADSWRGARTTVAMMTGISSSQQEQSGRRSVLCCRLRRRSAVSPY